MPELPEVETTLRGILPHLAGVSVTELRVRNPRLRYPVDPALGHRLTGAVVAGVRRRGKYLLVEMAGGHLLIHLGMSGSLRLVPSVQPPGLHDHVDLCLSSGMHLRYCDPRRFGTWLWLDGDPAEHFLLRNLGPEPLEAGFAPDLLWRRSRGKTLAVKNFIMDSRIVVGVGNIYANEALYLAGIHPLRAAGRIGVDRYARLHDAIRGVLGRAIDRGGTTLRDFVGGDGRPGYFSQSLNVYGRGGEPCRGCGGTLREVRLGQRTTVYGGRCQR